MAGFAIRGIDVDFTVEGGGTGCRGCLWRMRAHPLSFQFAFSMLLKPNLHLFVAIEFGTQVPFRSELFHVRRTERCVIHNQFLSLHDGRVFTVADDNVSETIRSPF